MSTSTNVSSPFTTWILPSVLERLNMYAAEAVNQLNSEIGGFIRIHEDGNDIFVTDIYIPKQTVSGGNFDVTAEMDNEFMRFMMKEKRREELPEWKGIVHSHPVGMGPSMSGVDVTAIQRRAEDSECYSLIISASRNADSTRMYMHYCLNYNGKNLIFRDMPVQVAWEIARRDLADKAAEEILKNLVDNPTKADVEIAKTVFREAVCESLPPTFNNERMELRKAIAAEVKEKCSKRFSGPKSTSGMGGGWQGGWGAQQASWRSPGGRKSNAPYTDLADLEKAWKDAQTLHSIGYDLEDPRKERVVSKDEAKRARKMHKKLMIEINRKLRKIGGVGMGDLVVVSPEVCLEQPDLYDMTLEPVEVEDFSIRHSMISYIVGGEILWGDEIDVVAKYEVIMDWERSEEKSKEPA